MGEGGGGGRWLDCPDTRKVAITGVIFKLIRHNGWALTKEFDDYSVCFFPFIDHNWEILP